MRAELFIRAAPEAVWAAFTRLDDWPRWNKEMVAAAWRQGAPWQEGSQFVLRHHSLFGVRESTVLLRMCAPGSTVVWETSALGLVAVSSAQFQPALGGCKLSARHSYHGALSPLLLLLRPRQLRNLEIAMQGLKNFVEGQPR